MALGVSPAELAGDRWAPWDSVPTLSPTPSTLVMCHCQRRGSQLLLGQECHLHVYEQGGVAQVRTQNLSPGASTGCSALVERTCLPGTKLGPTEGEMVASPGKAVRRAIPRLTTQWQARLRPAGLLAVLGTLLPPSGNPEHWALREEGPQPLKQTWCLQSSPTLRAGMSMPTSTAQGEGSTAQSWGGADRTGVGGAAGPLDLILCTPTPADRWGALPPPPRPAPWHPGPG